MYAEILNKLRQECQDLVNKANEYQTVADAENRDLSEDENKAIEQIFAEFSAKEAEIKRREQLQAAQDKVYGGAGTQAPKNVATAPAAPVVAPTDNGRAIEVPQNAHISSRRDGKRHGFYDMGEFAMAVKNKALGYQTDPRLINNALTTYGSEAVGADGGDAVPPEFREDIMETVQGEGDLLANTDKQTIRTNMYSGPIDRDEPWNPSGINAYWDGEASTATQTKPAIEKMNVPLHKLRAYVPVTDELLEDSVALGSHIMRKAPQIIQFKRNLAFVQGSGVGQPQGILNSPALVTVAKESGQAADTILYQNIVKMHNRLYAPYRAGAVWLINQDVEPQLDLMEFPTTTGATAIPVYLPPGGAASDRFARLKGLPVVPTEACNTLGDLGDIVLVSPSQYFTVEKAGGMRVEQSMHVYFEQDAQVFKFVIRQGGQTWLQAPINKRVGSNTLSSVVTLAARA